MNRTEQGARRPKGVLTAFAEIEAAPIRWLWPGRIPLAMLSVLDGDPDTGKSTVALDIAARLSRGDCMPDGSAGPPPAATVLLMEEDDAAGVTRPRLDLLRADASRVFEFSMRAATGSAEPFELGRAVVRELEGLMLAREAKLLVVDPLMAYLPAQVDSHRDQEVRRALGALRELAARTGAAVLVVRHLNKSLGGPAIYRGGGSIGISGVARSVMLLARDPKDPTSTRRILATVKSNLAQRAPSLMLSLVTGPPRLVWEGECQLSADALVGEQGRSPGGGSEREEAKRKLVEILGTAWRPAADVLAEMRAGGVSERTFKRARQDLGVRVRRVPGRPSAEPPRWEIALPPAGAAGESDTPDPLGSTGPLGTVGLLGDWRGAEPAVTREADQEGQGAGGAGAPASHGGRNG